MKLNLLAVFILAYGFIAAQPLLKTTYNSTDSGYKLLLNEHEAIQQNHVLNEKIIDLVDIYTIDSTYKRKTEVHRSYFFPIIRLFGVRWKTIKYTREKFVGTVSGASIPRKDAEHFTEYDVNFNLVPHLPGYLKLSHEAYLAQQKMFKSRKKTKGKEDKAPYILPSVEADTNNYQIHCECTPNSDSRTTLNNEFYPTIAPMSLEKHPNFGERHPTIGLYGPYILDCNHRCHPEIHPYEWYWWYDVNPQKQHSKNKRSWFIGFFRDVSNRFKHWSSSPRVGELSVPFIFPLDVEAKTISVEHIEYDNFDEAAILKLDVTEPTYGFFAESISFKVDGYQLTVNTNILIQNKGIRFYLSDVNIDNKNGYLTGKFNLAMAVTDIWTGKISFEYLN